MPTKLLIIITIIFFFGLNKIIDYLTRAVGAGGWGGALSVEMGFYADNSWESPSYFFGLNKIFYSGLSEPGDHGLTNFGRLVNQILTRWADYTPSPLDFQTFLRSCYLRYAASLSISLHFTCICTYRVSKKNYWTLLSSAFVILLYSNLVKFIYSEKAK